MCWLSKLFKSSPYKEGGAAGEIPSPYVDIPIDGVRYVPAMGVITVEPVKPSVWLTTVDDTNSMEPLIDVGHTVILSADPELLDKVTVGCVIVWMKGHQPIIHSVIEVGEDEHGWYCRTQGLNAANPDPEIIRKEQVKWVAIGVVWTVANEERHYD